MGEKQVFSYLQTIVAGAALDTHIPIPSIN